ncbi:glycoside hydrolase family 140 protein [Pseudonocardia sp. DLS-67]
MAAAKHPRSRLMALSLAFLAASCAVLPGAGVSASGGVAPDELVVSADGRYLSHADGRPFLWVGDTAWGIFGRLTRPEITEYLTARAQQGFTVIQMVTVFPTWDGVNADGVDIGELGEPNPEYFELVDHAIDETLRLGMYPAVWPVWSRDQHDLIDTDDAEAYGTFLGARYADKPVIWVFGGDDTDQRPEVWRRMARGVAIGETGSEDYGASLMTYHPAGQESSSQSFEDDEWLDFDMVQTGHDSRQRKPYEMITDDHGRTPVKPVLDAESMYEKHADGWDDPDRIASSQLVRNYMYWAMFAGAFGHTYGHWYIWPFVDTDHIHPYSDIAQLRGDWRADYLHDEVAEQVRWFRALMESRPFQTGVPAQDAVVDAGDGLSRVQATRANDGAYLMAYTPGGESFTADLTALSGDAVNAWWYDPRTGTATPIPDVASGTRTFEPPSDEDWVLVADDAARGFGPPGR